MKYVAIDCETTGLDPETCQILEVGAAIDDLDAPAPLDHLPTFHCYLEWDEVRGHPRAMAMNAVALGRIASREPGWRYRHPSLVGVDLGDWLAKHLGRGGGVTAAGKNFGSFDLQFLRRLPGCPRFRHRYLDPAILFARAGDDCLPDLDTCLERAGLPGRTAHTALGDALLVVELMRVGWARRRA